MGPWSRRGQFLLAETSGARERLAKYSDRSSISQIGFTSACAGIERHQISPDRSLVAQSAYHIYLSQSWWPHLEASRFGEKSHVPMDR